MTVEPSHKPGDHARVCAQSRVSLFDRPRGRLVGVDLRRHATVLVIAVVKSKRVVAVDEWWYMIVGTDGVHGWTCWGLERA